MLDILYIAIAFLIGHTIGAKGWLRQNPLYRKKSTRTFVTAEERDMLLK